MDVQREVAAALESVFPRVGLKAFVSLTPEEKAGQLVELAHLILGIRVFNFDIGKGGAGISDISKAATDAVFEMERKLNVLLSLHARCCSVLARL